MDAESEVFMRQAAHQDATALTDEELRALDAHRRAANYLAVGQIYLVANPLLSEPLKPEHIKPCLFGHWGTSSGLNLGLFLFFASRLRLDTVPEWTGRQVSRAIAPGQIGSRTRPQRISLPTCRSSALVLGAEPLWPLPQGGRSSRSALSANGPPDYWLSAGSRISMKRPCQVWYQTSPVRSLTESMPTVFPLRWVCKV